MSKGLEALDNLVQSCFNPCDSDEVLNDKAIVEKSLKALEIIKENECDMRWLKYCIKGNLEVETYNNGLPEYYEKLTEEEFNLLKEVLE